MPPAGSRLEPEAVEGMGAEGSPVRSRLESEPVARAGVDSNPTASAETGSEPTPAADTDPEPAAGPEP